MFLASHIKESDDKQPLDPRSHRSTNVPRSSGMQTTFTALGDGGGDIKKSCTTRLSHLRP